MNRNAAIVWTVLATLFCGWPGICLISVSIPGVITQSPKTPADIVNIAIFMGVGFLFVAFSIIVAFNRFKASKASGITGLVLMAALSGLLQICSALFFIIAAGAATNTTGMGDIILSFSISGWSLVGISILIWFIHARSSASNKASAATTFWVLETALFFGLPGGLILIYMILAGGLLHVLLVPKDAYMFGLQDIIMLAISLIGVAIPFLVWFLRSRFRKPATNVANEPLAPLAYKPVSTENDPGYTNSTKIMLAVLAIAIVTMIIAAVMNNG